jgi:hypothetical protein
MRLGDPLSDRHHPVVLVGQSRIADIPLPQPLQE